MKKFQLTRNSAKRPGDFAPFFDWPDADESPTVGAIPDEDLAERIIAACEEWQSKGGVLVRCHFGVKTVRAVRDHADKLTGFYETQKYCCPLAPLLDGLPSRFNPLADFAAVLGVDHLWVVGFIHGFDKTELYAGKRLPQFNESLSYVDGRAAADKVGARFHIIDIGWERSRA